MSRSEFGQRRRFLAQRERLGTRELVTPEGVALNVVVASAADRASAFLLDFVLVFAIAAMVGTSGFALGLPLLAALAMLASFAVRNFYFIYFEYKWQGMTPGKRWRGLRVIDRHGGQLDTRAIIARNLTRDIEVFLPLTALLVPDLLWPGAPGWARALATLWFLLFALLPLFNSDRQRIGDLVAGTMVVMAPKAVLLADIGQKVRGSSLSPQGTHVFTKTQLDIYGIRELYVLEDLLRHKGRYDPVALGAVADRVRNKIGWRAVGDSPVDAEQFLRDFYHAQRARLETKMLLGYRQEQKVDRPEPVSDAALVAQAQRAEPSPRG